MMKKLLSLLFVIGIPLFALHAQNPFNYNYRNSPTDPGTNSSNMIIALQDGGFMGVIPDSGGFTVFSFYKINATGNMIWRNRMSFPGGVAPVQATLLADFSVAFVAVGLSTPYDFLVVKMNSSGSPDWIRELSVPGASNCQNIVPTTDGGMIIVGGGCAGRDMLIHMDVNGNIVSQKSHDSNPTIGLDILDMVHDGNNLYSGWGMSNQGSLPWPYLFFKADSAGNIFNISWYDMPGYGSATGVALPYKAITKASGGGHYCSFGIYNTSSPNVERTALFYINKTNQFVWAKVISSPVSSLSPFSINGTGDNGCLLCTSSTFSNIFISGYPTLSIFMKFDSVGNNQWVKMPGDTNSNSHRNWQFSSITPASGNQWVGASEAFTGSVPGRYLTISRIDSSFNGCCSYTPFTPIISALPVNVSTRTIQNYPLNFTAAPVSLPYVPATMYRFNSCTGALLDSMIAGVTMIEDPYGLKIYPNPTSDKFNVEQTGNGRTEIRVSDLLGKILYQTALENKRTIIDTEGWKAGIYFVMVTGRNGSSISKISVLK